MNLSPLGKAIKKGMIDRGISQIELAAIVGTTPQYLSHILSGRKAGMKYLHKIAKVLEIDISKFVA